MATGGSVASPGTIYQYSGDSKNYEIGGVYYHPSELRVLHPDRHGVKKYGNRGEDMGRLVADSPQTVLEERGFKLPAVAPNQRQRKRYRANPGLLLEAGRTVVD